MKITGSKAKIVGRNIKYVRNSKGLSQNQLAKRIGCSRVYINRIESGRVVFSEGVIREISKILRVSYDSLFNSGYGKQLKTATDDFLKEKYYFPGGYAKVYWAFGFIFGDGKLSGIQLIIEHKHREPLEIVREVFRLRPAIGERRKQDLCHLTTTDKVVLNYLKDVLGFVKQREKRLFPNISEEYLPHFMRGFFDAHGSCYILKERKRTRVKLSYESKEFLETVVGILFRLGIVKKRPYGERLKIHQDTRSQKHHYFIIDTKRSAKRFFEYVYQNSNSKNRDEKNYKRFCKKLEKAEQ